MLLCGLHPHVLELAWEEITGATFTTCGLNPKFGHVSEARRPLRDKRPREIFHPPPAPGIETKQQLRLNQTNAEFLLNANVDSSDPTKWGGHRVVLYLDQYAVGQPSVVFFADDDGAD